MKAQTRKNVQRGRFLFWSVTNLQREVVKEVEIFYWLRILFLWLFIYRWVVFLMLSFLRVKPRHTLKVAWWPTRRKRLHIAFTCTLSGTSVSYTHLVLLLYLGGRGNEPRYPLAITPSLEVAAAATTMFGSALFAGRSVCLVDQLLFSEFPLRVFVWLHYG